MHPEEYPLPRLGTNFSLYSTSYMPVRSICNHAASPRMPDSGLLQTFLLHFCRLFYCTCSFGKQVTINLCMGTNTGWCLLGWRMHSHSVCFAYSAGRLRVWTCASGIISNFNMVPRCLTVMCICRTGHRVQPFSTQIQCLYKLKSVLHDLCSQKGCFKCFEALCSIPCILNFDFGEDNSSDELESCSISLSDRWLLIWAFFVQDLLSLALVAIQLVCMLVDI